MKKSSFGQLQVFKSTIVAAPVAALDRFGMAYDRYLPQIIEKISAKAGLSAEKCMSAWAYINSDSRTALYNAALALGIYNPKV